jgi:hypothetical protein
MLSNLIKPRENDIHHFNPFSQNWILIKNEGVSEEENASNEEK